MKPVVIYISEGSSKINLTKEEFAKYLKDAYDSGYNDGYSNGRTNTLRWDPSNTFPPPIIILPMITQEPAKPYDPYKITCTQGETSNTIGD